MKDATEQKWATVELATVSKVFTDGNWIETKDQASQGIRLVQTGNVGEGVFKDRRDKARWIDDQTFDRLNCFEVLPGDCLVSRLPDPVGRACIIPETGDKMITAVDCTVIRPDEAKIDRQFFVFYSQSSEYLRNVDDRCTGTTRRRISRKNLGKIPIPLPPLEEQQRIVAILDEAFEGLDRARANAEANLQNARELFEQSLALVFTGAKKAWQRGTIGDLCILKSGATVDKSLELPMGDVPYIKVAEMNLPDNLDGIQTSIRFLNRKSISPNQIIAAGSTIFPKRGGAILTNKKRRVLVDICADLNVMSVLPGNYIDPDFLYYFFLSVDMRKIGSGSSIPQINNYDIAPLEITYPEKLETQAKVADDMRGLQQKCDMLIDAYEQQIQDLNDLRQSLLQKAFAGELT